MLRSIDNLTLEADADDVEVKRSRECFTENIKKGGKRPQQALPKMLTRSMSVRTMAEVVSLPSYRALL